MSVRAYRIIKIERADENSFNLWHDTEIMDFLEDFDKQNYSDSLNMDGGGQIEFSVKALKALLKQKKIEIEDYQRRAIQSDIDFAKAHKDDYVLYDCF